MRHPYVRLLPREVEMNLYQGLEQSHLAGQRQHPRREPVIHCSSNDLPGTVRARLRYLGLFGNLLHLLPNSTNFRD